MQNDSPGNDPKTVWQNQPTEPSTMTLEQIRQKTHELHSKTRRALLGWIVTPLLVASLAGWIITWVPSGTIVWAVFAVAICWSLVGQYFLNLGMWSAPQLSDPLVGVKSYRQEIERRRSLSQRFLLWSFGPMVLSLAATIWPLLNLGIEKGMIRNMIPFLSLVVIWIGMVFVIRMRDQRDLQREIKSLAELERDNK